MHTYALILYKGMEQYSSGIYNNQGFLISPNFIADNVRDNITNFIFMRFSGFWIIDIPMFNLGPKIKGPKNSVPKSFKLDDLLEQNLEERWAIDQGRSDYIFGHFYEFCQPVCLVYIHVSKSKWEQRLWKLWPFNLLCTYIAISVCEILPIQSALFRNLWRSVIRCH